LRQYGLDVTGVVERTDLVALPDEVVLERACEEGRVLVTRNVGDFARLDHGWQAEGRRHHGLVMVTEQAFPQNRNLVGTLVTVLLTAARAAALPAPAEVQYLRPPAHP
jgi:hypothetical protein